jgi:geranylgeranyl diphosphate synthase, type I
MGSASLLTPQESCRGAGLPNPDADSARAVEGLLTAWLYGRVAEAESLDRVFCEEVARPVADFVLRGGKRLRASFAWWGWRAAGGAGVGPSAHTALHVAASLELLQALALIHDDVMDRSDLRRGAAAVHVEFADRHRAEGMRGCADHFGVAGAVLAGDLALVWAEDLLAEARLDQASRERVRPLWRAMRTEMVAGQYLDLRAQATAELFPDHALRVAALKTAAYTVQRPLGIGAALAGATEETRRHLEAAACSAGIAFQLRDDLAGVFGDPAETGKPAGDDVREGKTTYLAAIAWQLAERTEDHQALHVLRNALGDPQLTPDGLADYRQAVIRLGARDAVSERIETLVMHSMIDLSRARLAPDAEHRLADLFRAATRVTPEHAPAATAAHATVGKGDR